MKSGHKVESPNTPNIASNNSTNSISRDINVKKQLQICENCGKSLKGNLLKVDEHNNQREFLVEENEGGCQVIPYHAISSICFDKSYIDANRHLGE